MQYFVEVVHLLNMGYEELHSTFWTSFNTLIR